MIIAGAGRCRSPARHAGLGHPAARDRRAGPAQAPRRHGLAALDRPDAGRGAGRHGVVGNARNAGLLAVRILAASDPALREGMVAFQDELDAGRQEKGDAVATASGRAAARLLRAQAPGRRGGGARLVGIDVARCMALLGMVATHVLPSDPDGRPPLGQWLAGGPASALFALLAGVSLALMTGGRAPVHGRSEPPVGKAGRRRC